MDSHVKISGAWKRLSSSHVRVSGAWKRVNALWVRVGGVWKAAQAALSATASPSSVSGSHSDYTGWISATTSEPAVCVPVRAIGSVSYLWEYVSGDSEIQPQDPTSAGTLFTAEAYLGSPYDSRSFSAQWRCRVTDATTGAVAYSPAVEVLIDLYATD